MLKRIGGPLIVAGLLAGFLFLASKQCSADTFIGIGSDIVHQPGMGVAQFTHAPATVLAWRHNYGMGATYDLRDGPWQAGLGAIYVRHTDGDVGTHSNFLFTGRHCWSGACLGLVHISHGSMLGIKKDKPNSGLNFLLLQIPLR